jgi:hypothetical protein
MTLLKVLAGAAAATVLVGVPAAYAQHRGGVGRSGGSHSGGGPAVVGRAAPPEIAPRVVTVAPVRFYQPYYVFRPRVSLGFGLWSGFPISYSYGYYNPFYSYYYPYGAYAYPAPYPAYAYPYPATVYPSYPPPGYPSSPYPPAAYPSSGSQAPAYPAPPASIGVQGPNQQANTGGLSFEVTPDMAEVFVDGSYVGTVGQFTPRSQPLGLTAGRHRVEIRAPGYRTMDFDVDIVPGQVIPYQGALER